MKTSCFLLTCLFSLVLMQSFAQNNTELDSLTRIYKNKKLHDTTRLNAMDDACRILLPISTDRSYPVIREFIKTASKLNGAKWEGRSYHRFGVFYARTGMKDSAYYFAHRSLALSMRAKDKLGDSRASALIAILLHGNEPDSSLIYYQRAIDGALSIGRKDNAREYLNMAMIYRSKNNLPAVLERIEKALSVLKLYEDKVGEASAYNTIAMTHISFDNMDQAEIYLLKELKLIETIDDPNSLMSCYITLCTFYLDNDDVEKCEQYLERLRTVGEMTNNKEGVAHYHSFRAQILLRGKHFEEAKKNAELANDLFEKLNLQSDFSSALTILGEIEIASKHYASAVKYCSQALNLTTSLNERGGQASSCNCLYEAYKALGQSDQALRYHELFTEYKDSTLNVESVQKLTQYQMQFDFDKKQLSDSLNIVEQNRRTELEHLEDLEKGKRFRITLFATVGILFLIVGFGYRENRRKKKQAILLGEKNGLINKSLHEKELLLKEIHHRVKNNFQTVSSLLNLQSRGVSDEETLKSISEGQSRIKAMSLIHQKLYESEDISTVDFQEYIEQLTNQIASMFSLKELEIEVNANNVELDIDTSIPLGLILNELITNACKYAYVSGERGKLTITLNRPSEEFYKLEVKDSGAGIPENVDLDKTKSFGLRLVKRLTMQLQGSFKYQFSNGGLFEIAFKDTAHRKEVD